MRKIDNYILEKLHINKDSKYVKEYISFNDTHLDNVKQDELTDDICKVLKNFPQKDKVHFMIQGNRKDAFGKKDKVCVWFNMYANDNDKETLERMYVALESYLRISAEEYFSDKVFKREEGGSPRIEDPIIDIYGTWFVLVKYFFKPV